MRDRHRVPPTMKTPSDPWSFRPTWERWLARLWTAVEEDGVDYLSEVVERWGELCRTPERASRAADDWVSGVRLSWSPEHHDPGKAPRDVLDDLIASTPDDPGRWFATAKGLGFLDLAADLAHRSPVDIGTLLRAARDHLDQAPEFALAAATAALHWMARGQFYEIKALDVWQARNQALAAAAAVGRLEENQALIAGLIQDETTDPFVRKHLQQAL
jgi:hypothetical protein